MIHSDYFQFISHLFCWSTTAITAPLAAILLWLRFPSQTGAQKTVQLGRYQTSAAGQSSLAGNQFHCVFLQRVGVSHRFFFLQRFVMHTISTCTSWRTSSWNKSGHNTVIFRVPGGAKLKHTTKTKLEKWEKWWTTRTDTRHVWFRNNQSWRRFRCDSTRWLNSFNLKKKKSLGLFFKKNYFKWPMTLNGT